MTDNDAPRVRMLEIPAALNRAVKYRCLALGVNRSDVVTGLMSRWLFHTPVPPKPAPFVRVNAPGAEKVRVRWRMNDRNYARLRALAQATGTSLSVRAAAELTTWLKTTRELARERMTV